MSEEGNDGGEGAGGGLARTRRATHVIGTRPQLRARKGGLGGDGLVGSASHQNGYVDSAKTRVNPLFWSGSNGTT